MQIENLRIDTVRFTKYEEPKKESSDFKPDSMLIMVGMGSCITETDNPNAQVLKLNLDNVGAGSVLGENDQIVGNVGGFDDLRYKIDKRIDAGLRLRGVTIMAQKGTDIKGFVGAVTKAGINSVWSGNGLKVAFYDPDSYRFTHGYTLIKKESEIKMWQLRSEDLGFRISKK